MVGAYRVRGGPARDVTNRAGVAGDRARPDEMLVRWATGDRPAWPAVACERPIDVLAGRQVIRDGDTRRRRTSGVRERHAEAHRVAGVDGLMVRGLGNREIGGRGERDVLCRRLPVVDDDVVDRLRRVPGVRVGRAVRARRKRQRVVA